MSDERLVHDTIRLEKRVTAPLGTVWQALADTDARAEWGVPEGAAQEYS